MKICIYIEREQVILKILCKYHEKIIVPTTHIYDDMIKVENIVSIFRSRDDGKGGKEKVFVHFESSMSLSLIFCN